MWKIKLAIGYVIKVAAVLAVSYWYFVL